MGSGETPDRGLLVLTSAVKISLSSNISSSATSKVILKLGDAALNGRVPINVPGIIGDTSTKSNAVESVTDETAYGGVSGEGGSGGGGGGGGRKDCPKLDWILAGQHFGWTTNTSVVFPSWPKSHTPHYSTLHSYAISQ